jgi:hypothetical protein
VEVEGLAFSSLGIRAQVEVVLPVIVKRQVFYTNVIDINHTILVQSSHSTTDI